MKKHFFLSAIFLLALLRPSFALDASVSFASFHAPKQNYIEIYLHIVGSTITYLPLDSVNMQAAAEVVILFERGETIVKFDKFNLKAPPASFPADFIDVKRYALDNGEYHLKVQVTDLNDPANTRKFETDLNIDYSPEAFQQSDIQLLAGYNPATDVNDPFAKMGYHLEPLAFNWYHKNTHMLYFFNEIYNADRHLEDAFFVRYGIGIRRDSTDLEMIQVGHKRLEPKPIIPLLLGMDISSLPSGEYTLLVEVRDRSKQLLSRKATFFERSNPYLEMEAGDSIATAAASEEFVSKLSDEEVEYAIRAIAPRLDADAELINSLIASQNAAAQRMYLFSYWANQNPNRPEIPYRKFMEVARAVDKMYRSGFGHGFESDRGYIYIRYGRPDDMIRVEDEPSAPPYEIWSYNHFPNTNQNNVRFLFYNPSLSPGNFQLLHSTARGEINNPQWQLELYRDAPNDIDGDNYIDATRMQDNFYRRAADYFEDF